MCEPTHSIVQYPDHNDSGDRTDSVIEAIPFDRKDGGVWQWLRKKLGNWFHFSKLGSGHSEAIERMSPFARRLLPQDTKYEALWWKRKVKLDGYYLGQEFDKEEALKCAETYANTVSIGNLTQLRQFLEFSMRKSERAWRYVEAFYQILTERGRNTFNTLLKKLFGNVVRATEQRLDPLIKFMLGFTRKRDLLIVEWADDTKLWV